MKGMRGLCVTVKAELEEMPPKVCQTFLNRHLIYDHLSSFNCEPTHL